MNDLDGVSYLSHYFQHRPNYEDDDGDSSNETTADDGEKNK